MGLFRKDTHIDTVRELVNAALKNAQKTVRWEQAHSTNKYGVPAGTTSSSTMIDAANKDLVKQLRKIADMIESGEIYKH